MQGQGARRVKHEDARGATYQIVHGRACSIPFSSQSRDVALTRSSFEMTTLVTTPIRCEYG